MNGLTSTVANLYNAFEPDFKITIAKGKFFELPESTLAKIKGMEGVKFISKTLNDKALLKNNDRQALVSIKGIDFNYNLVTKVDSAIYDGTYTLSDTSKKNTIYLGNGIASQLQIGVGELSSELTVFSPIKGKNNSLNPEDNLNQIYCTPTGIFTLTDELDYQFAFVNINTARALFDEPSKISALEIKCNEGYNQSEIQKKLNELLGKDFVVKNRYQLNDVLFKTLETEKFATFIILAFILIIATFNIIGALTMLIIEKKKDIKTLFSLGADLQTIRNIFMREGMLITSVGAAIGLVFGLFVCWLQIQFHLVKYGDDSVVPYYPIELQLQDFVWIFSLIMLIGFVAALYPVRIFTKQDLVKELT